MKTKSNLILATTFCAMVLAACNKPPRSPNFINGKHKGGGDVESDNETGGDLGGGKGTDGYMNLVCDKAETHRGVRAWRRLSNVELVNTVKDVFGASDKLDWSVLLSDIPKKDVFDTVQAKENFMESNRLKGYVKFAEGVTADISMDKIFPCKAEGAACVGKRIPDIGAAAWRRPLTAAEVASFDTLYATLIADGVKPDEAFPNLLQAMIFSPNFMYRSELGVKNAEGEYELTPYEMASALSYLLWRRPPDATLRDLATKDELKTTEAIAEQAKRLLADPKAKVAMGDFADMWLDTKKILNIAKNDMKFTDAAKASMVKEVRDFFVQTMYSATNSTFKQLLMANSTPADASAQFVYGAMPGADGQLMYQQPERRGLLGQAAFLASHTLADDPNPITRGVFVAERLLCVDFAPPPAVTIPEAQTGLSNKERFRMHSQGGCAACHRMLDPIGFALENFDVSGVFRTMDQGQPITVSQPLEIDGKETTITSPQGLGQAIAESKQGLECYARQTFRYALGRLEYSQRYVIGGKAVENNTQAKLDQCQIDTTTALLQKNGGDLKSSLVELISSPAFRTRLIGQIPKE